MRDLIYSTNIIKKGIKNASKFSCSLILQKAPHKPKEVLLLGLPESLTPGNRERLGT